jgi:hypothetical protein
MLRKEVVMHDHPAAALFPTMGADEFVTIHNAMTSNPNDSTPASTAAKGRKKTRGGKLVRVRRLPARKADPNAKNTYARYGVARPSRAKPGAIWGRPPTVPYDGELGIEICRLIATGANLSEAIRILCGPDTKLTRNIVLGWRLDHPELAALYTQACEKRVEAMENDLLEIADDTDRDYREGKNGKDIPNKEVVLRSKIRIESRQWLMARRDPQQWGDKSSVDVSANIMLLSPEERVQKALQLFDLMEKFVEKMRKPVGGGPLVYDPGDDALPLLEVPRNRGFGQK